MTREEAIANLNMISVAFVDPVTGEQRKLIDDTFEMAIRALEQEPFINKPCVSGKVCEHDKQIVLDKIRAEIKEWYWKADKQALAKDPCVVDAMIDLFIRTIDKYKYKIESEVSDAHTD